MNGIVIHDKCSTVINNKNFTFLACLVGLFYHDVVNVHVSMAYSKLLQFFYNLLYLLYQPYTTGRVIEINVIWISISLPDLFPLEILHWEPDYWTFIINDQILEQIWPNWINFGHDHNFPNDLIKIGIAFYDLDTNI